MSIQDLHMFSAASMNDHSHMHLWVKGASLFIGQINSFVKHNNFTLKIVDIYTFDNESRNTLGQVLNDNKSDKANPHNYHFVYSYIFIDICILLLQFLNLLLQECFVLRLLNRHLY